MADGTLSDLEQLNRIEARFSRHELMLRYARGRVGNFASRQIMTLAGGLVLALMNGPLFGLAAMVVALLGEAADCAVLRWMARHPEDPRARRSGYGLSAATAGVQALTISACVVMSWLGPVTRDSPLITLAFLAGAALNAALVRPYHPLATFVRLAIYAATGLSLCLSTIPLQGALDNQTFMNIAGGGILAYMVFSFLQFAGHSFRRNKRQLLELAEQGRDLVEARQDAERAASAKADFLATMSHEIRTPMNAVMGMSDLLAKSDLTPDQSDYALTIRSSARVLLTLINDILDLSRLEANGLSLDPQPMELTECVHEVAKLFRTEAAEKELGLDTDLDPDRPVHVIADDTRLRQVLINLIGNALKFTAEGGVSVRCGVQFDRAHVKVTLAVTDTGIGIAPDQQDVIFERFSQAEASTTRRFGGSGLGLTISRSLVEAMGGTISVQSVPGKGSTFTVALTLPRHYPRGTAASEAEDPAEVDDLTGIRVLVAEDNRVNRLLIRKFLADLPVTLDFARDGVEAVEMTRETPPDLVFMDMSMPRLNGIDATTRIRQSMNSPPVIVALTANAFDSDREACFAVGMAEFLPKPVSRDDLIACILRHCSGAQDPDHWKRSPVCL